MTEILILDYNRPEELKLLLESIHKHAKFDKKIVVLNNGGECYADEYWEDGLCDKVIDNSINIGCGAGTVQLFSQCRSDFAFYVQVDHIMDCDLTEDHINGFEALINGKKFAYIDLAGNQGHGEYSERAQFIKKSDYLMAPKEFGGPGPLDDLMWTEESMQKHLVGKLPFLTFLQPENKPIFLDNGKISVRSNPDGSQWQHEPDTKKLYCLVNPIEKFSFPPLSDNEWEIAINNRWPDEGLIPDAWKNSSFEHWNKL